VTNNVKKLFATILQVDPHQINDSSSPDTLEAWDSINHLNLIAAFEDEFSIDIEPEEIPLMMQNYATFVSIILTKIGA